MDKFNWIKQFYELRGEEDTWSSISDIIPNEFDDYFVIHWNVGIVDNFPFNEYPEKDDTRAERNLRISINRKHGLFLNPEEDKLFRQTTLKEIADKFTLNYDYKVLNNIKQTPAIKVLDDVSIQNLKVTIKNLGDNNLNLFVEDIFRYAVHDENPIQEMINVSVDNYFKWQEVFSFDYCTYLFPNNRKWCITTSEDMPMFLCTKREVTEKLIKQFNMELFRVEYNQDLYQ